MKKHRTLALLGCAVLGLSGCGGQSSAESKPESSAEQTSTTAQAESTAETTAAAPSGEATAIYTPDSTWEPADASLGLPALNLGMTTEEMCRRAVLNVGNTARLANVMKRAQNKEAITVACIGGSITQGTGASGSSENYAYRNMAWWVKAFPEAAMKLNYVNAGIGATGSYIGVHRAERDLLAQKPDVVIVEFSVNDTDPTRDLESYDSLVRRILEQDNNPAVILLHMTQEDGTSLFETHKKIGEKYNLPMISYKNAVLPEIKAGKFTWQDISPDNIHPNNNGHGITAELLWSYYNSVLARLDSIDTSDLSFTAEPVGADRYKTPDIKNSSNITPISNNGFTETEVNQNFPHNWTTETPGAITFEVAAQNIGILYQRTIDGKSGQYDIYVDGEVVKTLDGNFPKGWGNYAEACEVYTGESSTAHTVMIKMADNSSAPGFTLLGLLVS